MTARRHEPTDACYRSHCFSHDVDEPHTRRNIYIRCLECGHVYYTAGELRRAYRRQVLLARPRLGISVILSALTIRARSISFCQECIHDF